MSDTIPRSIVMEPDELVAITGQTKPKLQVAELHARGFFRAHLARGKFCILERGHYEAVISGRVRSAEPITPITIPEPRKPRPPIEFPWESRTALYRHFDKAGKLLYVGIAVSPDKRASSHRREQVWAKKSVRVELEWFDTRREAMAAERAAIQSERPKYNILHQSKEPA